MSGKSYWTKKRKIAKKVEEHFDKIFANEKDAKQPVENTYDDLQHIFETNLIPNSVSGKKDASHSNDSHAVCTEDEMTEDDFKQWCDDILHSDDDVVDSDDVDEGSGDSNLCDIKGDLAKWAINRQIKLCDLKELLDILQKYHPSHQEIQEP